MIKSRGASVHSGTHETFNPDRYVALRRYLLAMLRYCATELSVTLSRQEIYVAPLGAEDNGRTVGMETDPLHGCQNGSIIQDHHPCASAGGGGAA